MSQEECVLPGVFLSVYLSVCLSVCLINFNSQGIWWVRRDLPDARVWKIWTYSHSVCSAASRHFSHRRIGSKCCRPKVL